MKTPAKRPQMRNEYNFQCGTRGKYARAYHFSEKRQEQAIRGIAGELVVLRRSLQAMIKQAQTAEDNAQKLLKPTRKGRGKLLKHAAK